MDPGMIARLRRGQAEGRDRRLAEILVERGVLGAEESRDLRRLVEPGALGAELVRRGRLSSAQLAELERDAGVREVLETVRPEVPPEVRAALENTLARVGKYALVKVLGRGGMGEVWKAWDTHLNRWVALKFLTADNPDIFKRFFREANLASQLAHPGIVRVYEVNMNAKRPHIALEFVDGRSLENAKLERRRAAEILRDAARAVQHAHERGLIHRDLKPANLLESKDGRVLVTDFGLARPLRDSTLTAAGDVLGTPSFMAPEQAAGRPGDERTDVYGLGATLYALTEGIPPVTGNDAIEILAKLQRGTMPLVEATDELAVVLKKAIEPEPADRYPTAAAMADDLERFLRGEPVQAKPVGSFVRAFRHARRHWVASTLLLLLLAAAAAAGLFGTRLWRERGRRERETRADRHIERVRSTLIEIQRMRAADAPDEAMLGSALEDLDRASAEAVAAAPDYASALFHRGLALQMLGRFVEAEAFLTRVLDAEPGHHDARARRGVGRVHIASPPVPSFEFMRKGLTRVTHWPISAESRRRLEDAAADFRLLPPAHPEARFGQATLAHVDGDYARARDILGELLRGRAHHLEAREFLARTLLLLGEYESSEREADRAIRSGLRRPPTYALRAFARAARGFFTPAIEDANKVLELNPAWTAIRKFRALWLLFAGRRDESLREYDALVAQFPGDLDLRINRSRLHSLMGDRARARADAVEAVRLAPDDPWALIVLGRAAANPAEAIDALTRALRTAEVAEAYYLRALAHAEQGSQEPAIADFRRAIALEPDFADFRRALAVQLLNWQRLEEAEGAFDDVVRLLPGDFESWLYRGQIRAMQGRPQEAAPDFGRAAEEASKAIQADAKNARAWKVRAQARGELGNRTLAVADAAESLRLDPGQTGLRWSRAAWLLELDRMPECLAEYDRVVSDAPTTVPYLLARAEARLVAGDRKGALADAGEAHRLEPGNVLAGVRAAAAMESPEKAIEFLQVIFSEKPYTPEGVATRGWRYSEIGNARQAEADLRMAVRAEPAELRWRTWLGLHYQKADAFPEAEEEFSELIRLHPEHASSWMRRGEARFSLGRFAEALGDFEKAVSLRSDLEAPLRAKIEECRRRRQ